MYCSGPCVKVRVGTSSSKLVRIVAYVPTFTSCGIYKRRFPSEEVCNDLPVHHAQGEVLQLRHHQDGAKGGPRVPIYVQLGKPEDNRERSVELTWSQFHLHHSYFVQGFWSGSSGAGTTECTPRLGDCRTGTRRRCPRRATRSPAQILCWQLARQSLRAR